MFSGHEFGTPFRVFFSSEVSLAKQNLSISFISSGNLALIDFVDEFVEFIFACCLESEFLGAFLKKWRNSYLSQSLGRCCHGRASSKTGAVCRS
jgi:hypothetical protein